MSINELGIEVKKLKDTIKQLRVDLKYWKDKSNESWKFEKEFRHLMHRINTRDYDLEWKNTRLFEALYYLERQLP